MSSSLSPSSPTAFPHVQGGSKEGTTQRWLLEQMVESELDRKVASLLKRTYNREEYEELLSFVHLWFSKWGRAGTCDQYISEGKPPTAAILACWCEQKYSHHLSRIAQDALAREFKGVRTQMEVRVRKEKGNEGDFIHQEGVLSDPTTPESIWTGSAEDGNLSRDFIQPSVDPSEMFAQEELALARDIIRVRRRRASDRYTRFFDHLIGGLPKEEAAVLEGVSELRVTHLYQRVRDDLRQAPVLIEVALLVLRKITEEPYTTLEELEEEESLRENPDLHEALELLVLRGLATEERGSSFVSTPAGRSALEVRSLV